jgi:putative flippase GtrA
MTIGRTIPRYLAVGAACAVLNNMVLIGASALHLSLAVAIPSSFVVVCIFGYRLHAAVTFGTDRSWIGLGRYVLAMTAGLPLSASMLWLLVSVLSLPMVEAAPITTVATLLTNFFSSRWAMNRSPRAMIGEAF